MLRRTVALCLAVLVALPLVAPVSAAQPSASPSSEPSAAPTATVEPTPSPLVEPTPTPAASADPGAPPAASDAPAAVTTAAQGVVPDATGRYIVMLRSGADTAAAVAKAGKHDGVKADQTFTHALRGYAAKLDKKQKQDILADPNVVAVVPDGVITVAASQTVPTGVSRIGGLLNPIAKIDGTDQRVDADVAIVDTGIALHPDLNVAGGYNCSSSNHAAWADDNHHGTHVAGTVGALDNGFGVVGVAPGVRLWAVKILNSDGNGLISWYVCGLDWILAQRDPVDPTRPLFEAVNMSVTKAGSDDHNCGFTNNDPLHQAICRVVAGGITVVAAAANDHHDAALNIPASYDEVITVSALADTDGKPGGLGGNACFSWGTYDQDDTFADFSNYGADVDIMAPGKCIISTIPGGYGTLSGTSMAAPAVAGAVALYKSSRPNATPAEVKEALRYLGNLNWKVSTDPDPYHEPLLDVSRIDTLGTFSLTPDSSSAANVEAGGPASFPVTVVRSPTFFERVTITAITLPDGWTPGPATSVMGWTSDAGTVKVVIPKDTPLGPYDIGVQGTNQGRTMTTTVTVNVVKDDPTAQPPSAALVQNAAMATSNLQVRVHWPAATDPTSAIGGYEVQASRDGGTWGATQAMTAAQLVATYTLVYESGYRFRVRAMDVAGNWSPWAEAPGTTRIHPVDDRSAAVIRRGIWIRPSSASAWHQTLTLSKYSGAYVRMNFTGRTIAVVAPQATDRWKARVYIDERYVTTISLYSTTATSRRIVYLYSFPTSGNHGIKLVVVGGGARPYFGLDAFVVLR